jgi:hypothetical protein
VIAEEFSSDGGSHKLVLASEARVVEMSRNGSLNGNIDGTFSGDLVSVNSAASKCVLSRLDIFIDLCIVERTSAQTKRIIRLSAIIDRLTSPLKLLGLSSSPSSHKFVHLSLSIRKGSQFRACK